MGSLGATASTNDAVKLPVINISEPSLQVGKDLLAAATKFGFLYVDTAGTGFSRNNVDAAFELSRQFFVSPQDQKKACEIGTDNNGWTGMHTEILDPKSQRKGDFKEALNIGEFDADGNPRQKMPKAFEGHTMELHRFQQTCRETCNQILDLLAVGLEVEQPQFFTSRHTRPSGTTLRLLHYPAIPDEEDYRPEIDIRAGAHSDYGSITLLFQRDGQPGLEIRTPEDTWAPVKVIPDGFESDTPPILVNIADLLSYWTNGILKSTVHRVIFPAEARKGGEDRYSIAFFYHPGDDTELIPIPSHIVQAARPIEDGVEVGYGGGAATKRAMTAGEHLRNRLTATYSFRMGTGEK